MQLALLSKPGHTFPEQKLIVGVREETGADLIYHEALGIGPGCLGKAFDGDPAVLIQPAFVHKIGSFLPTFGNYLVTGEGIGGPSQQIQRKFSKCWHCLWFSPSPIFRSYSAMNTCLDIYVSSSALNILKLINISVTAPCRNSTFWTMLAYRIFQSDSNVQNIFIRPSCGIIFKGQW